MLAGCSFAFARPGHVRNAAWAFPSSSRQRSGDRKVPPMTAAPFCTCTLTLFHGAVFTLNWQTGRRAAHLARLIPRRKVPTLAHRITKLFCNNCATDGQVSPIAPDCCLHVSRVGCHVSRVTYSTDRVPNHGLADVERLITVGSPCTCRSLRSNICGQGPGQLRHGVGPLIRPLAVAPHLSAAAQHHHEPVGYVKVETSHWCILHRGGALALDGTGMAREHPCVLDGYKRITPEEARRTFRCHHQAYGNA